MSRSYDNHVQSILTSNMAEEDFFVASFFEKTRTKSKLLYTSYRIVSSYTHAYRVIYK